MPFANFKVPAGTITPEQKKLNIDRTTDLYGEAARQNVLVLVDEVVDGG
ncbi:tautomerase family protein [Umezawaea tangerina]|uniref:4-oxalocrotonate tautomerase n=1 Tax=Umezawaea tangerina TaxID=84725 RepID=A0A2T0T002_9PSEU|nr:tautomerase family protein [Umezawaea tangerina]PRY38991.1 4-oxalocrotonate tautomerase [Umezawaea tangerina]